MNYKVRQDPVRRDRTYELFYLWQSIEEMAVTKEGKKKKIYSKFNKFLKAKCELGI